MTFFNPQVLSGAFATSEKPVSVRAALVAAPQSKLDYSDPHICPYCKQPMIRSTVRTMSGVIEPVYLCPDDRSVGVVPDSDIDASVFSGAPASDQPQYMFSLANTVRGTVAVASIENEITEKNAIEAKAQFATDRDEQMAIARDGRFGTKWILANNASCHTDVLDMLAHDKDTAVRGAIARHNKTPDTTLKMLRSDYSPKVRSMAIVKLKQRGIES